MKMILPRDGGPICVYAAGVTSPNIVGPAVLVLVEIDGGPFLTLTPYQWNDLVRRIRAARSARDVGA